MKEIQPAIIKPPTKRVIKEMFNIEIQPATDEDIAAMFEGVTIQPPTEEDIAAMFDK